jgi:hypothetical protein
VPHDHPLLTSGAIAFQRLDLHRVCPCQLVQCLLRCILLRDDLRTVFSRAAIAISAAWIALICRASMLSSSAFSSTARATDIGPMLAASSKRRPGVLMTAI